MNTVNLTGLIYSVQTQAILNFQLLNAKFFFYIVRVVRRLASKQTKSRKILIKKHTKTSNSRHKQIQIAFG